MEHTIEGAPIYDIASRVAEGMVVELTVRAAASVVELFVQTLVVLQMTPFPDSGLMTWQYDPLKPCAGKMPAFLVVANSGSLISSTAHSGTKLKLCGQKSKNRLFFFPIETNSALFKTICRFEYV